MLMNYLGRPSIYLPICTMGWGLISALTGELFPQVSEELGPHTTYLSRGRKRVGPSVVWNPLGDTDLCSFVGVLLCRFFLGFVEAVCRNLPVNGSEELTSRCSRLFFRGHSSYFLSGTNEASYFCPIAHPYSNSCQLRSEELGVRVTILFCATFLSGAFGSSNVGSLQMFPSLTISPPGSVMAAGILNGMEGKLGHSAWR